MTDDVVYKTIPLPLAKHAVRGTRGEREARVLAHMSRVHPQLAAIEEDEARVQRVVGDPKERQRFNTRKSKRKQRALARERAAVVAGRKGLDGGREVD